MVRNSSPTQLLMADGVSVHGLVQPTLSFSSEIGGKNAPPPLFSAGSFSAWSRLLRLRGYGAAIVVAFTNEDEFFHQIYVNAAGMTFDSHEQTPGQVIEVNFPRSGDFAVRCHIHPK